MWPFTKNAAPADAAEQNTETGVSKKDRSEYARGYFEAMAKMQPALTKQESEAAFSRSFQRPLPQAPQVSPDGKMSVMDSSDDGLLAAKSAYAGIANQQLDWYMSQGFIGYQACAAISQHWLIDKVCTMPAEDAVRVGYNVSLTDDAENKDKILERIRSLEKRYHLKKNLIEFARMNRVFGIRVALFKFDLGDRKKNKEFYENPFNPDGVKGAQFLGISQIDPTWVMPELSADGITDAANIDFYEPEWWVINGNRYHKSHFVIVRMAPPPDLLKPTYFYGGVPLAQQLAERVYAAERTANESPILAMSKRLAVISTDLEAAIMDQPALEAQLSVLQKYRDNFGVFLMQRGDNFNQVETALADLDVTIMTQYQLVAAIGRVPSTKLLGTTPKGFNSSGDYEESSYHEYLESIQENELTPLVKRFMDCIGYAFIGPEFGVDNMSIDISWNPCDAVKNTELADINLKKAQLGGELITAGVISPAEERRRLVMDKDSGYNDLDADDLPEMMAFPDDGEPNNDGEETQGAVI